MAIASGLERPRFSGGGNQGTQPRPRPRFVGESPRRRRPRDLPPPSPDPIPITPVPSVPNFPGTGGEVAPSPFQQQAYLDYLNRRRFQASFGYNPLANAPQYGPEPGGRPPTNILNYDNPAFLQPAPPSPYRGQDYLNFVNEQRGLTQTDVSLLREQNRPPLSGSFLSGAGEVIQPPGRRLRSEGGFGGHRQRPSTNTAPIGYTDPLGPTPPAGGGFYYPDFGGGGGGGGASFPVQGARPQFQGPRWYNQLLNWQFRA